MAAPRKTENQRLTDDLSLSQKENADLRKRVRTLETGQTSDEQLLRRLERAISENTPRIKPATLPKRTHRFRTGQTLLLEWSDLHAGEVVDIEATQGLNEYSWDIMLERMTKTQETVFSHAEHFGFNVTEMILAMVGDMLSGHMHEELAITNDRPTAQAVIDLAYDHAPWVTRYADRFGKVVCVCVPGNHPRFAFKPSFKEYYNNADWLFYKTLEALLKNDNRVSFSIPRSAFNMHMIGGRWRAFFMHGDGIRTTMPGVPWGGVHRRITSVEAQMYKSRTPLDFVFMGHWHSENTLAGIHSRTFMNGSVKGLDEFSLAKFGSGRPAAQAIHTFHPERGWTGQYACDLQPVQPASEGW